MALFKVYRGASENLTNVAKKDGNCYFCMDTAQFWVDHVDSTGSLCRKPMNAADAETLCGMTAEQIIASVDVPDVTTLISNHNSSASAHSDIRTLVTNAQKAAEDAQTTADGGVTAAGQAQARADAAYILAETKANTTDFNSHANSQSNPHNVSAAQVGAPTTAQFETHTGNKNNPHGVTAAQVGADPEGSAEAVQVNLDTHTANKSNPHGVTVSQIGAVPTSRTVNGKALSGNISLSAVDVGADASGAAADALDEANAYTDEKVAELLNNSSSAVDSIMELAAAMEDNADAIEALEGIAANKANAADLTSHTGNKSNPHGVTYSQVGADKSGAAAAVQTNLDSHTGNKSNPHDVTIAQIGAAAASDLSSHTGNKSNPHGVTASQVGLGNVPNVATNDQTPTYTAASSLTSLASGEKLSVAFGKIAKAISDLISHLSNKSNPHGVTAAQVGADVSGTASSLVASHNTNTSAHSDIRTAVSSASTAAGNAQTRADSAYNLANGKQDAITVVSTTLSTSGWSSNKQTVTVSGVLADETAQMIQPIPAASSASAYIEAGVIATAQAANSLTFTCTKAPTVALTIYVVITPLK